MFMFKLKYKSSSTVILSWFGFLQKQTVRQGLEHRYFMFEEKRSKEMRSGRR
jgi:hypothetical protein